MPTVCACVRARARVCVHADIHEHTHTHFAAHVKQFITGTVMGFSADADAVRDGRSGCTTDAMSDGRSLPLVRYWGLLLMLRGTDGEEAPKVLARAQGWVA